MQLQKKDVDAMDNELLLADGTECAENAEKKHQDHLAEYERLLDELGSRVLREKT